ncbi:ABC transporter ATP-binding protein [Ferruginibacter sp. HRS2-29]|uniref:ABC transporter ATP-binding protein n=1 Tax=Ferruginibacter sp. HRS2-29 TaxID=2487334 RepID=UPI0020CEB668|nr:ABC transporter ATP-binding protein [Ferruginibacter sp. HRS2-29]MCP9753105.1 ABC transporter ATP-binding protein [Ferruginibacter sp. HRS2-29]
MKILWQYLRPFKWLVILSLALAGITQLLSLIDPLIFGKIIDEYALNPQKKPESELVNGVLWWLAIAVGVAMAARLAKTFQDYVLRLVVQKFGMQIFNDGLKQTLRLSYQEFEEQRSGETLSILQKTRRDTESFITSFINILFSSLVGIGFLVWYAINKHWALIPVFLIGVLLLGGLTGLLSKKIKTVQRSIFRENAKMSGSITESLRNIELVKSLGLTYSEIRRLKGLTQKIFDLEMEKVKKVRTLSFLQGTTLNILKQSILFILLWLIFRHVLSPGELISMQFITNTIFGPLQELGNIILSYREAEASLQNFDALMKKPVEYRPEEPIDVGEMQSLQFDKVVFRHKTAAENSIDHISFSAKVGDSIAFVGPSGSGKSTLVKLLVGLYAPVEGNIYFDGISVKDIRYNRIRKQIGFVTQETQLFAGTIRDNLQFTKAGATDEEMTTALTKASAGKLLQKSDKGLDTMLGEGGTKLSGGEKQRLSIARALLRNPRLLIFDEATSALDSLTEEDITETIRNIAAEQKQIIISIAHRLSTIMYADRIYVLEKGRIVETGSHHELVEMKGLYYAMWRQQIGERKMIVPEVVVNTEEDIVDNV